MAEKFDLEKFCFHGLHPQVSLGAASDRYAGWVGQIYPPETYEGRCSRRQKIVGGQKFVEEVLPVESVRHYFRHFDVLELDYTFYGLLLDRHHKPTATYRTLRAYESFLPGEPCVFLKVPQVIFASKLYRGGTFVPNPDYLAADIFRHLFYEPAVALLGDKIKGFIFEQEYQRARERSNASDYAEGLRRFFEQIPPDPRYHVEIRTASLVNAAVREILREYGIGQVFSHWTWLPRLRQQLAASGASFPNQGRQVVVRLMTPRGMRYEEAYARAHPFKDLLPEMISPGMIEDTVEIMTRAVAAGRHVNVIVNNRAGGNAPSVARLVAARFCNLQGESPPS